MIISTNMSAQISAHNLNASEALLTKSLARLSSGSKITSPAEDDAGRAVASGTAMLAQANALPQSMLRLLQ